MFCVWVSFSFLGSGDFSFLVWTCTYTVKYFGRYYLILYCFWNEGWGSEPQISYKIKCFVIKLIKCNWLIISYHKTASYFSINNGTPKSIQKYQKYLFWYELNFKHIMREFKKHIFKKKQCSDESISKLT